MEEENIKKYVASLFMSIKRTSRLVEYNRS